MLLHSLAAEELNGTVGELQAFHEDKGPTGATSATGAQHNTLSYIVIHYLCNWTALHDTTLHFIIHDMDCMDHRSKYFTFTAPMNQKT